MPRPTVYPLTLIVLTVCGVCCGQNAMATAPVRHELFAIAIPGHPREERGSGEDPAKCWTTSSENATPVGSMLDRFSGVPQVFSACVWTGGEKRTLASETERGIGSFRRIFGSPEAPGDVTVRVTAVESSGASGNELRLEDKKTGFVLRAWVFVSGNAAIRVSALGYGEQAFGKVAASFFESLKLNQRFREGRDEPR